MSIDPNNPEENEFQPFPDEDVFREDEIEEIEPEPVKSNRTFWAVLGVIGGILVVAVIVLVVWILFSRNRAATRFEQQAAAINAENTAIAVRATTTQAAELSRMTEKAMPPTWTPTKAIVVPTKTPQPSATSTAELITSPVAETTSTAISATAGITTLTAIQATSGVSTQLPGTYTVAPTTAPIVNQTVVPTDAGPARTATVSAFLTQVVITPSGGETTVASPQPTTLSTSTALPDTGFADEVGLPGMIGLAILLILIVVLARRLRLAMSD